MEEEENMNIKRILDIYKAHRKVKIKLKKRFDMVVAGIFFNFLNPGDIIEAPAWLAKILVEEGIAEYAEKKDKSRKQYELMGLYYKETKESLPTRINSLLDIEDTSLYFEGILIKRLDKILKAIKMGEKDVPNITFEEKILLNLVYKHFKDYLNYFLKK